MDGSGEHYAKWNKGDGERQISYDLTFNWNIINRRKSKENITRDTEVKNNVTIAKGEWGTYSEGRDYKNTEKKPKGSVELGKVGGFGWGGV